jgi:hypothetical protein
MCIDCKNEIRRLSSTDGIASSEVLTEQVPRHPLAVSVGAVTWETQRQGEVTVQWQVKTKVSVANTFMVE